MSTGAAYFGSRVERHVAADMEALAQRGFTGVLHTFSENDLRFYRGTMGALVRRSQDAGLEVQIGPWGVCHMFGGEAFSQFVPVHPEVGQVLETGRPVPAGCPNNPRVREFVREWIDAAIDTGADRIFCDEPHWVHPEHFGLDPRHWGCRCDECRARFRAAFGEDMPTELVPEVLAFREDSMVDFIGDFVGHVARHGARAAICPLPLSGGAHGIRDWSRLAALPGLDTFGTDPYWKAFGEPAEPFVREYARRVVTLGREHGVRPQIWIQGFSVQAADAEDIAAAVRVAREEGVEDLWVWGFEACGHMSALAPDDPEAVWRAICDAMLGERVES
jgi:hypothetical protein